MEEFTQCQICFENFDFSNRIPLLLVTCQHSFCYRCLKNTYKVPTQIECPSCRQVTKKRIEELPKNRLIVQYLELNHSQGTKSHSSNGNKNQSSVSSIYNSYQPAFPISNNKPTAPVAEMPIFHDFNANKNSHRFQNRDFSNNNSGFSRPEINIPVQSYHNQNQSSNSQIWDDRKYFKEIFDSIDYNCDGKINFAELHEALIRGTPNSEFDQKTVKILLNKYDKNHDNEIDFEEFHSLFIGINNQYNEFLDYDQDFSGTIDSSELTQSLTKKGYNLNGNFVESLIREVNRYSGGKNAVSFDIYVRILARIDHLRSIFNQSKHDRSNFENFIKERFFMEF